MTFLKRVAYWYYTASGFAIGGIAMALSRASYYLAEIAEGCLDRMRSIAERRS